MQLFLAQSYFWAFCYLLFWRKIGQRKWSVAPCLCAVCNALWVSYRLIWYTACVISLDHLHSLWYDVSTTPVQHRLLQPSIRGVENADTATVAGWRVTGPPLGPHTNSIHYKYIVDTEPADIWNMNDLISKSKALSKQLQQHTLDTIVRMANEGKEINYVSVSKEANVSRPFLYGHREIREKIDACRVSTMTKDELRKEVIRLRTTNK